MLVLAVAACGKTIESKTRIDQDSMALVGPRLGGCELKFDILRSVYELFQFLLSPGVTSRIYLTLAYSVFFPREIEVL